MTINKYIFIFGSLNNINLYINIIIAELILKYNNLSIISKSVLLKRSI